MRVYVITKMEVFKDEIFVGVRGTRKQAEDTLKNLYPDLKNNGDGVYLAESESGNKVILFIREEEITIE